jgi:magnesium transporter
MITSFVCTSKELKKIPSSELKNYLNKKNSNIWVNIDKATTEEISVLKDIFKIHPTTIEDIFSAQTIVKYEDFDHYKLIIFKGIKNIKKRNIISFNIPFIIGQNFVITIDGEKEGTINNLLTNEKRIEYVLKKGAKNLLHYIIDNEVDEYVRKKAELNEELVRMEIEFMTKPNKEVFAKSYSQELIFLELRQLSESVTDLCLTLTKSSIHREDKNLIPYFKDVYEHARKTTEDYKSMLKRISGMQEMYATITSMKTNEVMRSLTIIMALMMPLTIITGFYGMNVNLPLQNHPSAWTFLVIAMFFSAIGMIIISIRRGWIAKGEKQ